MNQFEVTGRLVRDIEQVKWKDGSLARTKTGNNIYTCSIADQHSKKAGDVSFFNISLFGKVGDDAVNMFKKGALVHAKGWLKQKKWQAKDGSNRTSMEFYVQEIYPVLPKAKGSAVQPEDVPAWIDDGDLEDAIGP